MKECTGRIYLTLPAYHQIRADTGMSRAAIRLRTPHPTFASIR
jgi:hypothetical protein